MTDPEKEISPAEAKKKNPAAEVGTEILAGKPTDLLGWIAASVVKGIPAQPGVANIISRQEVTRSAKRSGS